MIESTADNLRLSGTGKGSCRELGLVVVALRPICPVPGSRGHCSDAPALERTETSAEREGRCE